MTDGRSMLGWETIFFQAKGMDAAGSPSFICAFKW
jgi:hypothetical protein